MNQKNFVDKNIEYLLKDKDVARYINKARSPEERARLEAGLNKILADSYDHYAKEYFDTMGFGSYASLALRIGGLAGNLIGTYAFWGLMGEGLVAKLAGFGMNSLADLIDNRHYEKTGRVDEDAYVTKEGLKILGETAINRAAAFHPFGVGEVWDFLRGRKKYDSKVLAKALYQAKDRWMKEYAEAEPLEDQLKVVSMQQFQSPYYYRKAA